MEILFIGRFQPFHKGHLKTLISLAKKADLIKIVIGSKQFSFEKETLSLFKREKR
jgi:Nicotinamide mononucleotide adenylyltransferase